MGKKHIFTPKEDDTIIRLYQEFKPIHFISEQLNLSIYNICNRIKQLGIPTRNNQEVIKRSNLEKYGYEYPFQSKEIQEKLNQPFLNNYGVPRASMLPEAEEKRRKTCLSRFGQTNNSKTQEWKEQHDRTCLQKFGQTNNSKTTEWKKSVQDKWKEKSELEKHKIVKKRYNTNLDRYGVEDINQQHIKNYDEYLDFVNWVQLYLSSHDVITPSVVSKHFGLTLTGALSKIYSTNTEHLFSIQRPQLEYEIEHFLKNQKHLYRKHDRTLVKPYELDFYIPSLRLALEVNDIASHINKSSTYHLNKTLMCEDKGIILLHLWEWEFTTNLYDWLESVINTISKDSTDISDLPDELTVNMDKPLELFYLKNYTLKYTTDPKIIYSIGNSNIYDCGTRKYVKKGTD